MWVGLYILVNYLYYEHANSCRKCDTWLLLPMDSMFELSETWLDAFLLLVDA